MNSIAVLQLRLYENSGIEVPKDLKQQLPEKFCPNCLIEGYILVKDNNRLCIECILKEK